MDKKIFFVFFCMIIMMTACGSSETGESSSSDVGALSAGSNEQSTNRKEVPTLSKEKKRLFYETINVRTIGYRKNLKSLQKNNDSLAKSPAIEASFALLSDPAFDDEAFRSTLNAYLELFVSGAQPVNGVFGKAYNITCHSYLDKLVGNNRNGLSQSQMEALKLFVQKMEVAGVKPTEVLNTWNSAQLEDIADLIVVTNIKNAFK